MNEESARRLSWNAGIPSLDVVCATVQTVSRQCDFRSELRFFFPNLSASLVLSLLEAISRDGPRFQQVLQNVISCDGTL